MAVSRRPRRRRNGVHVVVVPRDALRADVAAELGRAGMSMSEFRRLGRAGALRDERLRDLWLMAGPALG